jgi:hypothetical protein
MAASAITTAERRSDFVERATAAFRRRLAALVATTGLPREAPEPLGERAGLAAAAGALWTDHAGPFLDTEGVSALLDGVSKQAVSQRVRGRRLLALETGSGRLVYPLWQFHDGAPLPGLGEVLAAAGYDPTRPATGWTVASWLATDDPDLGGAPRALLAAGRLEPVLAAARDVRLELGADEWAAGGEAV